MLNLHKKKQNNKKFLEITPTVLYATLFTSQFLFSNCLVDDQLDNRTVFFESPQDCSPFNNVYIENTSASGVVFDEIKDKFL